MTETFDIDGYGGYVWLAWAIGAVVISGLITASIRSMRARESKLAELETASPRRQRRDRETKDAA